MSVKSSRLALLGVGVVLFAAGIAGCGGGDEESEPLTKDEFIAQANEFCADFTEQSNASTAEYEDADISEDIDGAADSFQAVSDQMGDLSSNIDGLGAPEGDEDTVDQLVELSQQLSESGSTGAEALRNEDLDAVTEANANSEEIRTEFNQIATDYGLTECAP